VARRTLALALTRAAACALLLSLAACPRPQAAPRAAGPEPDLRIGIVVGGERVRVEGQGGLALVSGGDVLARADAGAEYEIAVEGRAIVLSGGAGAGRYERLTFVSLEESRFVTVDSRPYRGVIEVFAGSGSLTVVNELPIEAYLAGVVNAEMGRRSREEQAALEAQAIVARTYALKNRGKFRSEGYDLQASVADQAYGGVAAETDGGRAAVRATAGMVLTYRGELITTFFHSTCGGSTASPEEAFRTVRATPYLRPVSDRRSGGHYCDISPRFRWTIEWDGETLRRILRRTVPAALGIDASMVDVVRDVRVHRTGPSGRVTEAHVQVGAGDIPVFAPDVRSVFETPDGRMLASTALRFEAVATGGSVDRLTVHGMGWGHGVGMCQWGAVGRARAGQDAKTIVTTYFPGTRLERLY
jgi:stage II sporulation protein D